MSDLVLGARKALHRLRAERPLVQCITNQVAANFAANAVLALGASPAMVWSAPETGDFVRKANSLSVNLGTLSEPRVAGMRAAIAGAQAVGRPWVLDPVAHHATAFRRETATAFLAEGPVILRGNASEILALAETRTEGKGADSAHQVEVAADAARSLARAHGCVVVVTGVSDLLTDGQVSLRVSGGSPLMARVTATGCALSAVTGAFAAVATPMEAALAALLVFAEAGERAAQVSRGPGSFAPAFLDALYEITPEMLGAQRVSQP